MNNKKTKNRIFNIAIILVAVMCIICLVNIVLPLIFDSVSESEYTSIAGSVLTRKTQPQSKLGGINENPQKNQDASGGSEVDDTQIDGNQLSGDENAEEDMSAYTALSYFEVDFTTLKNINSDIKAWLYSENTPINYPVLHTSNNKYYLNHLYNKAYNAVGSIFIDYTNEPDFSDRNTVLHGHNMRSGAMLGSILKYSAQSYYNAHKEMELITDDATYRVLIFSGYSITLVPIEGEDSMYTSNNSYKKNFINDESFLEYIKVLKERSEFSADVEISSSDKIITLSTCMTTGTITYNRYVLHGVLVPIE